MLRSRVNGRSLPYDIPSMGERCSRLEPRQWASPVEKSLDSPVDRILSVAPSHSLLRGMRAAPPELIVLANREPYRHEDATAVLSFRRSASGVVNAVEPLLVEALRRLGGRRRRGRGSLGRDRPRRAASAARCPALSPAPRLAVGARAARLLLRLLQRRPLAALPPHLGRAGVLPNALPRLRAREPAICGCRRRKKRLARRRWSWCRTITSRWRHCFIRRQLPQSRIATFWHIPWPRPETFAHLPVEPHAARRPARQHEHRAANSADRDHFLASVEQLLHADVDHDEDTVTYKGRRVAVGVFPASIEWPGQLGHRVVASRHLPDRGARELDLDGMRFIGVGVDRLDYTKGIEQKFLAIEWLLERRPDLVGPILLRAARRAEPRIAPALSSDASARARDGRANQSPLLVAATEGPIRLLEAHHAPPTVARFFRAADFCYVGSLHDGMNLVEQGVRRGARRRTRRADSELVCWRVARADRRADHQSRTTSMRARRRLRRP